jgi:hypothetical protein
MEYFTEGDPVIKDKPVGPPNRNIRGFKNKETKLNNPCEFTLKFVSFTAGFISGILLSIVFVVVH